MEPAFTLCQPKGLVTGENVTFGENVKIWNYVVIGDDTKIGDRTKIASFCDIGKHVEIGSDCLIQAHVTISNRCKLGDRVFIGPNTSLLNDRYPLTKLPTPCIIEDDVIIGGGVTVLPAVRVGHGAVVGAASVVTHDVSPNTVVYGNPARRSHQTTPFGSPDGGTREDYELKRKRFISFYEGQV